MAPGAEAMPSIDPEARLRQRHELPGEGPAQRDRRKSEWGLLPKLRGLVDKLF